MRRGLQIDQETPRHRGDIDTAHESGDAEMRRLIDGGEGVGFDSV